MRNRIIIAFLLVGFSGCKEVDKLTQFTMSFNNQVTIPTNTIINIPVSLSTPDIPTNSQATFADKETSAASIDEIKLQSMSLTIVTPADSNFNFFKSIEVFINSDGLSEVALGSNPDVADGITTLNLTTTDVNIKDYITAEKFSIRIATTTDQAIGQDHELNINAVFLIDAKVLGQ
ncbi:hypothetical protein N8371_01665 [Vicingaceae bacterium]|nr:hypothetical protein [Vicingaceae bacterium]